MGYSNTSEGGFTARRRHLDALMRASDALNNANHQLQHGAGELLAEDLRLCQQSLGEITGDVSADDLLGKIFSSFALVNSISLSQLVPPYHLIHSVFFNSPPFLHKKQQGYPHFSINFIHLAKLINNYSQVLSIIY